MVSAFSSDGHEVRWTRWDGGGEETLTLHWENEGWTAEGVVRDADVHYVVRLSAAWHVQQVLLFRDLEDPDLWIATDGAGRWGEINGAHRPELDGSTELWFEVTVPGGATALLTPFPAAISIRRLAAASPLALREAAQVQALAIDVETLGVARRHLRYERLDERRWAVRDVDLGEALAEFDVDEHGVPLDVDRAFRRV